MGALARKIRNIIWVLRFHKALKLYESRKYEDALSVVDYDLPDISFSIKLKICLLKGVLLAANKKLEDSSRVFECAAAAALRRSRSEKNHNFLYVQTYSEKWLRLIARELGNESSRKEVDYKSVDLQKVSSRLKRQFPMIDHPNWSSDAVN